RLADLEEAPEDLVHHQEGGGHPGGCLKEPSARQTLPPGEPIAQLLEPRFDLALLSGLRHRHVFVARHDLRRHRRRQRGGLGRLKLPKLLVSQKFHLRLRCVMVMTRGPSTTYPELRSSPRR